MAFPFYNKETYTTSNLRIWSRFYSFRARHCTTQSTSKVPNKPHYDHYLKQEYYISSSTLYNFCSHKNSPTNKNDQERRKCITSIIKQCRDNTIIKQGHAKQYTKADIS